ncbi:MAG: outer membrane beta-barrel protein [Syntrophobacterales bacterium]
MGRVKNMKLLELILKRAVIILAVGLLFVLPSAAWGDDAQNYVTAGVGLYNYTGDITTETKLDEAFLGELSYGRYFHPNFVLEAGVGYIHDDHQGDELQGYPVTLTAIGVYPVKKVRLLGGGGIGVYPMNFDGEINGVFIHGRDTVLGANVLAGFHWDLRPSGFIGLEGKYLFIERAKFEDEKVELEGFTMMLKFGFRF